MNDELIRQIEELGLSEKEARVYVACVMLGAAGVQKIADQAGIKRVTTYVILESLIHLGLVSQSQRGKKTYFVAEDPVSLERLLEKKQREIEDQKFHFQALLPELRSMKNLPSDSPNVRFYDTAEGIRTVVGSFLSSADAENVKVIYGISNFDQLEGYFPEIAQTQANPDRMKTRKKSLFLYTTERGPILAETDKERNRESRFVPPDKYPINGDITIVGNNVVMVSLVGTKPIGVAIQSSELAKSMKALFDLAWAGAEQFN